MANINKKQPEKNWPLVLMQFKTIFIFEINNGEIAHVCVLWLLMNMMFLSK
jgi:hypothetical protein